MSTNYLKLYLCVGTAKFSKIGHNSNYIVIDEAIKELDDKISNFSDFSDEQLKIMGESIQLTEAQIQAFLGEVTLFDFMLLLISMLSV